MRTNKFTDIYFPTLICLAATIAAIYLGLTQGIKSIDELTEIKGYVNKITFNPRQSRQSPHYDFQFNNYTNQFKLPADFTDLFHSSSFMDEVKKNDCIKLFIEKDKEKFLNSEKLIFIYGIEFKNKSFIDLTKVIEIETWNRRILTPVGGIVLFLLTIGVFMYRQNKYG